MEIILLERIRNLGRLGDKVNVKAGYARNYLIPKQKAVSATKENIKHFEARRADLEKVEAETLAVAQKRAAVLNELTLTMVCKTTDEEGKLYGSIGIQELADAIAEQKIEIEKRELTMPEGPIRQIGFYEVEAHIHSDVIATVKVQIDAE